MPFSSLTDPADLARAQRALDATWERIRPLVDEADQQKERARLAYIVAAFALVAFDEADLAERAWKRFWEKKRTGCVTESTFRRMVATEINPSALPPPGETPG